MPENHSGIDQKQSPGGAMINAVVAHIKAFAGYYKEKFFHYDLRAYNDLRPDDTGKNVSVYDICLSISTTLLANYFLTTMADE